MGYRDPQFISKADEQAIARINLMKEDKILKTTEWGEDKDTLLAASTYNGKPLKQKASSNQIGGSHYKKYTIQPAEFCHKNSIPYLEATAIKYLCRWRDKGGVQDLEKAKHFIDLLIEFENDNT
jgi:hypothetical protein